MFILDKLEVGPWTVHSYVFYKCGHWQMWKQWTELIRQHSSHISKRMNNGLCDILYPKDMWIGFLCETLFETCDLYHKHPLTVDPDWIYLQRHLTWHGVWTDYACFQFNDMIVLIFFNTYKLAWPGLFACDCLWAFQLHCLQKSNTRTRSSGETLTATSFAKSSVARRVGIAPCQTTHRSWCSYTSGNWKFFSYWL